MKIVIAVHHFPPRYSGGAELRAWRTAAALQARGHDLRVVCVEAIDYDPAQGALETTLETFEEIPVHRLRFNLNKAPDRFQWNYANPWIGDYLRRELPNWQPDVFHLIGGYLMSAEALAAARQHHIPRVVSLTDYWWLCPRIQLLRSDGSLSTLPINPVRCARCLGEEQRRYRLPARYAPGLMEAFWRFQRGKIRRIGERINHLRLELNQANQIICPSRFVLDIHRQAGIDSGRLVYARQGRDFPGLAPEMLEKAPAERLRVGYIGQITEIKGVHVLFQAARQMTQAPLKVKAYGDTTPFPTYTATLQRMAAQDERLELCGIYPRSEVSRVFQNLDVLVVPSLWYENSPNVILEAFAHRTPVIAADLGGMAELVQHEQNGLLFAPGDAAGLAHQLQRLCEDPALLARLQSGIEPVKGTHEELDELETIYRQVSA
ncbi:MAG: glycosyltransferase family 4 protein [Chloroflexota bacterium]